MKRFLDILHTYDAFYQCSNIIDKYGQAIQKFVVKGISLRLICEMIGTCTGDSAATTTTNSKWNHIVDLYT